MSTPFEKYEKKLKDEWAKLSLFQETCEHPKEFVESKNEGCSADYYNPAEYWTNHKCLYCGKRWTTPQ